MRTETKSRFWMSVLTIAALTAWSTACSDPPAETDEDANINGNDTAGADGTIAGDVTTADGAALKDGETPTTTDGGGTTTKDGDSPAGDANMADGAPTKADGSVVGADGSGDDGAGSPDIPQKKQLPLPSCAFTCGDCAKCTDTVMCVDGKTYTNDCYAICDLQDFDWPSNHKLYQGKCPECPSCGAGDKPGDKPLFCAKTKAGPWIPVMLECELNCVEFPDDADKCEGGKCGVTGTTCKTDFECNKKYIQAGGCEKQNACMQAPASCPVKKFLPVCADDGHSYQNTCAMDNCDLKGCYPLGEEAKSGGCKAGELKILCEGECYDSTKWKACASDQDCQPVCGIHKDGKGISYRNKCIANFEGASVGSCDGISATPSDKCAAQLYADANDGKGRGCCDIDYTIVKPVCASRLGADNKSTWYTFRSNGEFDCLTAGASEKGKWNFQYQGPCICQCPDVSKPVCGADGQTYQSACQATCYNGANFTYKDGTCTP